LSIHITYIISNTDKALAFEWLATYLDKKKFTPRFILLNPSGSFLESFLTENNFNVLRIPYNGKKDLIKVLFRLYNILKKDRPSVVHTHLFDASLLGLLAAKMAGIKTRIHTRHHSNSNHTYVPRAVKYDLFINRLSTDIIAISKNVEDVLIHENVTAKKIHLIHHGLDLKSIENTGIERVSYLKRKYALPDDKRPVIGVISRYIHLKGVQYIIPAFKKLLEFYPDAILILANAKGNYTKEIKDLLKEIPSSAYIEIGFEEDLFALYRLFDIYVHVPIDLKCEAFGQTYIEALAARVPSVFTMSGVAPEFIADEKNAMVAEYKDPDSIFEKMIVLLRNKALCDKLSQKGYLDVRSGFDIKNTILRHEQLYLSKI
jgi:glycosyltransferase involved in cell wall biosynthesis